MLQVLCVPFSEVFCVQELCLLFIIYYMYFYYAKEVFKSFHYRRLRVWFTDFQISEVKFYSTL